MFTTAGSTRFTIEAKLLEDGTGSGRISGLAEAAPVNENDRIAETFPETTVPIKMPTESVAAMSPAATYVRRRVQSTLLFDCSIPSCSYLYPWPCPHAQSITPQKAGSSYCA